MDLATITFNDLDNIKCRKNAKENSAPNSPYLAVPRTLPNII